MSRLGQRGDTIVEVLIAMSVASFVLGGAYAIANRSLANARQAQEHSEALQLAVGQIEALRAYTKSADSSAPTVDEDPFSTVKAHCFAENSNSVEPIQATSLPSDEANYPDACKNLGSVSYRLGFRYFSVNDPTKPIEGYFRVTVSWPSITGNGDDKVELSYKVHKQ